MKQIYSSTISIPSFSFALLLFLFLLCRFFNSFIAELKYLFGCIPIPSPKTPGNFPSKYLTQAT
jgi:hypothetical protein